MERNTQDTMDQASMEGVFSAIYTSNAWRGEESLSGHGSDLARTRVIRERLPILMQRLGARSLLDAPCGDFHWMKETHLDVDTYIGIDIVPDVIADNNRNYGNQTRQFRTLDLTRDPLPQVDVILCRDCLVHLSFSDIVSALRNFKRSGSRYLLTTTYTGVTENEEIITGEWRPINLRKAPFNFGQPREVIDEEADLSYEELAGAKCLGLWSLDTIDDDAVERALARINPVTYYRTPWQRRFDATLGDLATMFTPEDAFILVDEDKVRGHLAAGLHPIPFLERDGAYWGRPADDETAIRECERLRNSGAQFMVFAFPAFWWLEYYVGFACSLRSRFPCVVADDRLVVFDLR